MSSDFAPDTTIAHGNQRKRVLPRVFSYMRNAFAFIGLIAVVITAMYCSGTLLELTELSMFAAAPYGPASPEMRSYALAGPGTGQGDALELERSSTFLALQAWLRSTLHVTFSVPVVAGRCPPGNLADLTSEFRWTTKRILICTEYLDALGSDMRKHAMPNTTIVEMKNRAFTFAVMHELGHELVYDRHLPITGREEDAVDDLATIVAVRMRRPDIALAGAALFAAHSAVDGTTAPYDVHSPDAQRAGRIRCLVFGSDPAAGQAIARAYHYDAGIDRDCVLIWRQVAGGWSALLRAPILEASPEPHSLPQAHGAGGALSSG